MKKTLLVLGGGSDQLFMIRTAQRMGLKVIVIDIDSNAPGFIEADEYKQISTRDLESISKFIKNYQKNNGKIDGVSTMGSDIPHIVARVANLLNSPSISVESGDLATNKFRMKEQHS